jgi:hypothetical protein
VQVDAAYGPLRLLGYDWQPGDGSAMVITLHWLVEEPLAANYTATVQIFGAAGEKLGQDDRLLGGEYYPSLLWKSGETLIDRRTISLPPDARPARLLLGFYDSTQTMLAPSLELPLTSPPIP